MQIKIGATYLSKFEEWGPIEWAGFDQRDSSIVYLKARGSRSKHWCHFYTDGSVIESDKGEVGWKRQTPNLMSRLVVPNEVVYDGYPELKIKEKSDNEFSEEVARFKRMMDLSGNSDFTMNYPKRKVYYIDSSNLTLEQYNG